MNPSQSEQRKKFGTNYILMAIFGLLILAADQITKYLTDAKIQLHESVAFIPKVIGLTYVRNEGAAFSMLQGKQWLFAVIFVAFAIFMVWEFSKNKMPFKPLERWCIVAVFAGGLGNMIDRLRLGYVIDMIQFIPKLPVIGDFPIFNVADCFITCGCLLLIVHLAFFNKDFWKEDKK